MNSTKFTTFFFFLACDCNRDGTVGNVDICDDNGACHCKANVEGDKCDTCSAGFYNFPTCTGRSHSLIFIAQNYKSFFFVACACDTQGTVANTYACDNNGACFCKATVEGDKCDTCSAGYYNFPACTGRSIKLILIAQNSL